MKKNYRIEETVSPVSMGVITENAYEKRENTMKRIKASMKLSPLLSKNWTRSTSLLGTEEN